MMLGRRQFLGMGAAAILSLWLPLRRKRRWNASYASGY